MRVVARTKTRLRVIGGLVHRRWHSETGNGCMQQFVLDEMGLLEGFASDKE